MRTAWMVLLAASAALAAPGSPSARSGRGEPDLQVALAVRRGLDYLASRQRPNGCWLDRVGRKVHNFYQGKVDEHVGVTALAGLAFLANGSTPGSGRYAESIRRAVDYTVSCTRPNGFITAADSRMYEHAFATLFLAEVYGMTRDERVRACLSRATQLIVSSQNEEGGWRYLPGATDADMSVTVCQVFALRGARNAGILVPKDVIDRAILYVKRSADPNSGGFYYQLDVYMGMPSRTSFPLTAAGVATLYGAGEYDSAEIRRGLDFLIREWPRSYTAASSFDYFYGHYYGAQAAFQAGGRVWAEWYGRIRAELLDLQEGDGSWVDLVGRNYATAMATIILQIPYRYLPILER
ncbi:MAG: terpene cyclase/mutase family protein [Planctomycetes bacterium]|nr:terpene cyclase/mutase family protein [Planctomycetota bacterium]